MDTNAKLLADAGLAAARRTEFYAGDPDQYFDRPTVAAVRYSGTQTLESEAIRGGGIPYRRVGRRALYKKADVLSWIERNAVVQNTAQLTPLAG